jgi:hypothetical protein
VGGTTLPTQGRPVTARRVMNGGDHSALAGEQGLRRHTQQIAEWEHRVHNISVKEMNSANKPKDYRDVPSTTFAQIFDSKSSAARFFLQQPITAVEDEVSDAMTGVSKSSP